jgi:hypothetical protein
LSITRYLFFDRNSNWLDAGIRSFSEVTGQDRKNVEQMLHHLYYLMRSPAILSNESEVATYSGKGNLANYGSEALKVLIATLSVERRLRGDDSERFRYQYARTSDPQFVNRVETQLRDAMNRRESIGFFVPAVIQIKDSKTLLQIAKSSEAYSHNVPDGLDEHERIRFVGGAMIVAATAFSMSEDVREITNYFRRVMVDARFKQKSRPFSFAYGENVLLVPSKVVELFHSFLRNPRLISEETTANDLQALQSWIESYDYNLKSNQGYVAPASKILHGARFWHEKKTIEHFLNIGEGASPEKVREFKETAEKRFRVGDYWFAMGNFISARELDGLERTYAAMLAIGHPEWAAYAAFAMEWIRTGRSPFEDTAQIDDGNPMRLLGH